MNKKIPLDDDGKNFLCNLSDGDGRFLLNRIEEIYSLNIDHNISIDELGDIIHKKPMTYDKNNDSHYSLISAFHKSLRGSDPDAALYWFSRMIEGGEDPKYIGRRLIRCASEDIGLADPHALTISLNALESYKILGSPEGELCLAEAIIYVATCPKSNAVYNAYNESRKLARATGSLNPPKHIINAPTKFMKEQGFFEGYIYDHDTKDAFSGQNYFPDGMKRPNLYIPNERGFEREIKKRLEWWNNIRKNKIT